MLPTLGRCFCLEYGPPGACKCAEYVQLGLQTEASRGPVQGTPASSEPSYKFIVICVRVFRLERYRRARMPRSGAMRTH